MHDLLLRSTTARCRQIIKAVIFLFRATLCVLVLKPGTSRIRVHLSSTFLNNLFEAYLEETRWNYIHFAHVRYYVLHARKLVFLTAIKHPFDFVVLVVVRVGCREEEIELFGVLLVDSKDKVNPFMDVVPDVFSLKLFAQDPCQVERVSCVRRHLHLVYEELAGLVSYSLLLPKPCMEPVPVLVQLRHEVVFWN